MTGNFFSQFRIFPTNLRTIDFDYLLGQISCFSEALRKIQKSKMVDPRWSPFEIMTQFIHNMTSSAHVVDIKGRFFGGYSLLDSNVSFCFLIIYTCSHACAALSTSRSTRVTLRYFAHHVIAISFFIDVISQSPRVWISLLLRTV